MKKTEKRSVLKKILVVVLCVLMLLLCGCSKETDENIEANETEELTEEITEARTAIIFKLLEGTGITVLREDESEEAYEGMRIIGGDSIVTDKNSSVYFRVDDDKNILLDKDSKMIVEELSNGKLLLELEYGEFFFNVENKLKSDETMVFKIGTTSMSIRGTSGAGSSKDNEGSFAIYTGVGTLTSEVNPDVEYSIMPSTIAHFDEEKPIESIELAPLKEEEVSPLLVEYAEANEEYKEELEEKGWEISEEGVKAAEVTVPETAEENAGGSYIGWKQNKDGSWTFSQEDFNNGIGPTYYKEEKPVAVEEVTEEIKTETTVTAVEERAEEIHLTAIDRPSITCEGTVTYDGHPHAFNVEGIDTETMNVSSSEGGTDSGRYVYSVSPKSGYCWTGGSTSAVTATLNIEPIELNIQDIVNITKEYDGCVMNSFTYTGSEINKYLQQDDVAVQISVDSSETNAGTYQNMSLVYEITGEDRNNYKIADTSNKTCTYLIRTKTVTVTMTITGKDYDGQPLPAGNIRVSYSGVIENDDFQLNASPASDSLPGTYAAIITLNGSDKNNYDLTVSGNTYTIAKKVITARITGISGKTYDGNPKDLSGCNVVFTDTVEELSTVDYDIVPDSGGNAGTYNATVTLKGDADKKYTISSVTGNEYTITKKSASLSIGLTITENSAGSLTNLEPNVKSTDVLENDKQYLKYKIVDSNNTEVSTIAITDGAMYTITPRIESDNYNASVTSRTITITCTNGIYCYSSR